MDGEGERKRGVEEAKGSAAMATGLEVSSGVADEKRNDEFGEER